jgi:DNA invertase Pin-like site-specific DNA recombinase
VTAQTGGDDFATMLERAIERSGRLMLNAFAAFAQFQLEIMKERQREGIADTKAAGKYKGRKPTARAKATDAVSMWKRPKDRLLAKVEHCVESSI